MNLSKEFTKLINKDKNFLEALEIVKKNGSGKIWLIGGALSRNISCLIHNEKNKATHDYDFVIEKLNKKIILPKKWNYGENKFGSPKIKKGEVSVDIIPLNKVKLHYKNPFRSRIKNFLLGVPFTPQSIAYDIEGEKIFGEIGIKAIKEKIFAINNLKQARIFVKNSGISVEDLVRKKAKSMSYKVRL